MNMIEAREASREHLAPPAAEPPVGIVGFGLLGEAMALRLLRAGRRVLACDVDPVRHQRIAGAGASPAPGPAAVARQCRWTILAPYSAAQVFALLDGFAHEEPPAGPAWLLCAATLAPDEAEAACDRAAGLGWHFAEMPISGSSREVELGHALALVGSGQALPADLQAMLQAICPRCLLVGPRGQAARLKHVINLVLELNRAALAEGLVLAQAHGLDLTLAESALRASAAASKVMDLKAAKMRQGDFRPEGRLEQSLKDMQAILARAGSASLPLAQALEDILGSAVRAGDGGLDSAAIIRELHRRSSAAMREALQC